MKPKKPRPDTVVSATSIAHALTEADDFGFEVQVRAMLEAHLESVKHGWSYIDPVEGKARQFDLRGVIRHRVVAWAIRFAIECKNLHKSSPLVVSGVPRTQEEAFHDLIVSRCNDLSDRYSLEEIRRSSFENQPYPAGSFVGKNIIRLKGSADGTSLEKSQKEESEVFGRWAQALASSQDLAQENDSRRINSNSFAVIVPGVVVPDGTLWTVEYDDATGKGREPQLVDATTIFVNNKACVDADRRMYMRLSHIHFWTISGLSAFLGRLTSESGGHRAGTRNPAWEQWFPTSTEVPPKTPV